MKKRIILLTAISMLSAPVLANKSMQIEEESVTTLLTKPNISKDNSKKIAIAKSKVIKMLLKKLAQKALPELGEDAFDLMVEIQSKDAYYASRIADETLKDLAEKTDITNWGSITYSLYGVAAAYTAFIFSLTKSTTVNSNGDEMDELVFFLTRTKYVKNTGLLARGPLYEAIDGGNSLFRSFKNGTFLKAAIASAASSAGAIYSINNSNSFRDKRIKLNTNPESLEDMQYELNKQAGIIASAIRGPLGLSIRKGSLTEKEISRRKKRYNTLRRKIYDKLYLVYTKHLLDEELNNRDLDLNLFKIIRESNVVSEERIDAYETIVELFENLERKTQEAKILKEMDKNKKEILEGKVAAIHNFYLSQEGYFDQQSEYSEIFKKAYAELEDVAAIMDQITNEDIKEIINEQ